MDAIRSETPHLFCLTSSMSDSGHVTYSGHLLTLHEYVAAFCMCMCDAAHAYASAHTVGDTQATGVCGLDEL